MIWNLHTKTLLQNCWFISVQTFPNFVTIFIILGIRTFQVWHLNQSLLIKVYLKNMGHLIFNFYWSFVKTEIKLLPNEFSIFTKFFLPCFNRNWFIKKLYCMWDLNPSPKNLMIKLTDVIRVFLKDVAQVWLTLQVAA